VSRTLFTGERLHEGDALFALDLARHRAAYEYALEKTPASPEFRVLDLGCGAGYGTARLAEAGATVIGIDRIRPDPESRGSGGHFAQADLYGLPLHPQSFDRVVSFQVIEHLDDPTHYLKSIAGFLREAGLAILTTPNILMSDGVNPYHVHEYRADELDERLREHFDEVEVLGVGMSSPVRSAMQARSQRIQRIMRLDPLRIRDRLPRALLTRLFAAFALLVRRRASAAEGTPDASWRDFPIEPAREDSIDLLALCRRPRR
jgi:SAM-dependent methyltransferase